jgi:uridylate kinase
MIDKVILKLSGEALMDGKNGISASVIRRVAVDVRSVIDFGVALAVVVGGGNFFRGATLSNSGFTRLAGDRLGMIATMLNSIAIRDIFETLGIKTEVMSPLPIEGIIERYETQKAIDYLTAGRVVVFAAGTGNPLVTTDTALCLRGVEIGAQLLLKATNVDGVYSEDPKKNPSAKLFKHLTYQEALDRKLEVMDDSAFRMGDENNLKLCIFNIEKKGAILRVIKGEHEGTIIGR